MNSLILSLILLVADMNMSNFTQNILQYGFEPYYTTLGEFFLPIFFMLLLVIIWTSMPSNKAIVPAVFAILIMGLSWRLFSPIFATVFTIIGGFALALIFYLGLLKKSEKI